LASSPRTAIPSARPGLYSGCTGEDELIVGPTHCGRIVAEGDGGVKGRLVTLILA
jgi:hypothetical protein